MRLVLLRKLIFLQISIMLIALVLFFQNCSDQYKITLLAGSDQTQDLNNGNGFPFEGKPNSFIQIVPGFQCEGTPSPAAEIVLYDVNKLKLIRNRNDKCGASEANIDAVDSSYYNPDLIGYREGIFERQEAKSSISTKLDTYTEAWCRPDNQIGTQFDVVVKFNSQTQVAMYRYYFRNESGEDKMSALVKVDSRFMDSNSVNYDAIGFSLAVDRTKPAPMNWWYFPAKFSGTVNNIAYNSSLTCRVASGKLLGSLQKIYPRSGQWNQYVKKINLTVDEFSQTDLACDKAALSLDPTLTRAECIHGAEKLVVETDFPDCKDLKLNERLGAFEWLCIMRNGHAEFVTTRMRSHIGLKDLLTIADNGLVSWKSDYIQIRKNDQLWYESEAQQWWTNPVLSLPDSTTTAISLTNPNLNLSRIYVLTKSAVSKGLVLSSDNLALVSLPGAELIAHTELINPCNLLNQIGIWSLKDPTCLVVSRQHNYIWFEMDLNGGNIDNTNLPLSPQILFLLTESNFTRVHNANFINNNTSDNSGTDGYGIFMWLTENTFLSDLNFRNNKISLLSYMMNNHTLYSEIQISDSDVPFNINGWNTANILKNIEIKNSKQSLMIQMSPKAIIVGATLNQITGMGFVFNSAGAGFETLFNILYSSNSSLSLQKMDIGNSRNLAADLKVSDLPNTTELLSNKFQNRAELDPCNNLAQDYIESGTFKPILRQALEIINDGRGNENGLCETGEACEYHPQIGAQLQGYNPDTTSRCIIQQGPFSGTEIRGL